MKVFLTAWAVLILFFSANAADCPLTLGASDAGWYNAANYHDPANNNYLVGYHASSMTEYRDWFVFDLPAFTAAITNAELRLFAFNISTTNGMETFELHHVGTPISTLIAGAGPGATGVFNDLADGAVFGVRTVLASEASSYITIPLNSNALTALTAASGQRFAIGGNLNSISPMPNGDERLFSFSSGTGVYVELKLSFVGGSAPAILQQPPATILLTTGGTTNISVAACGTSPLRYQWFVNNNFALQNQTNNTLTLVNISPSQAGDYFAVVTNSLGVTTSSVAHVYVNGTAPVISDLSDVTTAIGYPLNFYPSVSASPPATLQWRFNGVNIPGATNTFLLLPSVQFSDAGSYTIVASNALGMATSTAVLSVEPLLVYGLGGYEVDSGTDFYYPASVESSLPVTYQWRFNGTAIPGANSAYLSIFNASSNHTGGYEVIAANSYGVRTSGLGSITVLMRAPLVSAPSIPYPTLVGSDLIIQGNVIGSAPFSFQWLFNGNPIPNATNLQLVLKNLSVGHDGGYALVASNVFGVSTSAASVLSVTTQAPTYSVPGTLHPAFVGDAVRFASSFYGGPRPEFQWQFNGTNIPGATNSSLLLTDLLVEQSGVYVLNASNQSGAVATGYAVAVRPRRALDRWTWRNSRPQANDLKHIALGNGRAVAVGEGGSIVTSTNGIDWTVVAFGNHYTFMRVTFGNGLFAALSEEAIVFTSPDGLNWTPHELPFAFATSLDFANGEFLMVGGSQNTPVLLARSVNCAAWQAEPMAGLTLRPISIAYGNGFYVSVSGTELFVSQDSHTWTRQWIPTSFVRAAFANGLFVVSSRFGEVWTSTDGQHWFERNTGIVSFDGLTGDVNGLAYGNGQFVAVGDDGVIVHSADAVIWAPADSTTSKNLRDVVFDGTKFIACGLYGALLTSPNGVTWTDRRGGKTKDLYGIIYTNGQFVVVGYEGTILTSPNGTTWTTRSSPNSRDLHALTFGGGQYVAVGRKGTVLTSPNGITWTSRTTPTTNYLQRVTWGNGRFVAVGENATILSSTDAVNWQLQPVNLPGDTQIEGVAYGKGVFVVVGGYFSPNAHSVMLVSSNGLNWSNVSLDVGVVLRGVTFAFNSFLAVGNDGAVVFSGNGFVWSFPSTVPPLENLRHVKLIAGRAAAVGNEGTVLSYNLYNWEQHRSILAQNLHDLAYGAGKIVAVGNAGAIVQSEDVQPVFSAPGVASGTLRFNLRGGMEAEYNVQSSENFLLWENEDTFTNDGSSMSFTISTNGPHRFFRVRYP